MNSSIADVLREFRRDVVGKWLDLPALWADRRAVLRDPAIILQRPRPLKNKPLQFATQMLLVPTALLGTIAAILMFVLDPPATQLDREIKRQQKLMEALTPGDRFASKRETPMGAYPDLDAMTYKQLTDVMMGEAALLNKMKAEARTQDDYVRLDAERERKDAIVDIWMSGMGKDLRDSLAGAFGEARENRAFLVAIVGIRVLEEKYRPLIISAGLVLNSLLFGWLIRRTYPGEAWALEAHQLHLYVVPSALAPPAFVAGIFAIVAGFSVRYDWEWYIQIHNLIAVLLTLWSLVCLRRAAMTISMVDGSNYKASSLLYVKVADRLMASVVASQVILYSILIAAATGIFQWTYGRALAS
jgi:hypothetical protein